MFDPNLPLAGMGLELVQKKRCFRIDIDIKAAARLPIVTGNELNISHKVIEVLRPINQAQGHE